MEVVRRLIEDKPVVIFSKSSCSKSHNLKSLIRAFGANPVVYELDQIPNGHQIEAALMQLGCTPSVPTVFLWQRLVGGEKQVMSLIFGTN